MKQATPVKIDDALGKRCRGQVMTEYALMAVAVLGIALAMTVLLAVFAESGWRAVSLISLDL